MSNKKMNRVVIRNIELIAAKNKKSFVDELITKDSLQYGKLIAINAEKVITAEQQPEIMAIIQDAEYKYADGISISKSIQKKYPNYYDIERIPGVELWYSLMEKCAELELPVFLIGATQETISETKEKLEKELGINVVGIQNGYFKTDAEDAIIETIRKSGAKFVTVAMGSPKQEQFMSYCQKKYPNALYMGVGGTYDVYVGKVKRAPVFWQKAGLEWLYRLLKQPTRWRRQLKLGQYAMYYFLNRL